MTALLGSEHNIIAPAPAVDVHWALLIGSHSIIVFAIVLLCILGTLTIKLVILILIKLTGLADY